MSSIIPLYSKELISLNSVSNYHAVLINPIYELKKTHVKVDVTFFHLYKRYPVYAACELLASLPDIKHGGEEYCEAKKLMIDNASNFHTKYVKPIHELNLRTLQKTTVYF